VVDVHSLLAMGDRVPNLEARALSPTVGWLLLVAIAAFVGLCIVHAPLWRRLWLRAEDPRTIGLFRILFATLLLFNLAGLADHLEFLFTDEGLFSTANARKFLAAKQFGEHASDDRVELATWLAAFDGARHSLLLVRSDPSFFWLHLWVYVAVVVSLLVGFQSRTSAVLAWLLLNSLTGRNPIYLTGADDVFKVFGFLLMLTRSGHAYSVDNWLRCRRLRRAGRLDARDGPGGGAGLAPDDAHPHGLEAIYRRIPAWPRMLMILQLATIYLYTGCAKTGGVWAAGDSLYYALSLDHFYRSPPQVMTAMMGTNVFRIMTWVVHWWQIFFGLMIVGLVTRFALRERLVPVTGVRAILTRVLWVVIGVACIAIVVVALPVHYAPTKGGTSIRAMQWWIAGGGVLGMAVLGWLWRRLRDRPWRPTIAGRTWTIDLDTVATWLLGRRVWLTIGLLFHVQIFMLMNIGMFAPVMILVYLVCINGTEVASALRALGRLAARAGVPFIPADVRAGRPATPPEDPTLPQLRRDGAAMGTTALGVALASATGAIVVQGFEGGAWLRDGMFALAGLALVGGAVWGWRRPRAANAPRPGGAPWAYGPLGRTLASGVVVTHIVCIALHCIPAKDSCHAFRSAAVGAAAPWLHLTQTQQSWGMFAPNPMRTNDFLEVWITDAHGDVWDMRSDVNSPRNKPVPWIWYDRGGKITRRINGEGKAYRSWVARWYCREWALDHGGELPRTVELVKVWYAIPSPDAVAKRGYYRPADLLARSGQRTSLLTVRCATEDFAQPTNEVRARHGLPPVDESTIRRGRSRPASAAMRPDDDAAD
jgi:hypothetical protein